MRLLLQPLTLFTVFLLALTITNARKGQVWPQPFSQTSTGKTFELEPSSFSFVLNGQNIRRCKVLEEAFKRYKKLLFLDKCLSHPKELDSMNLDVNATESLSRTLSSLLNNLTVQLGQKCEEIPHPAMEEMYTLRINSDDFPDQAFLFSNSVWGALRGLETFSQLVWKDGNGFFINSTFVVDKPRFTYRGLLVDTSRHFIPLSLLFQTLDAMSYNKLNVFHWHIVDDPSFPFVSKRFPNLSERGAYSKERVYNPEDVQEVIDYARLRGIRVMVEFDTPGHTLSWGKGQEGLLTPCFEEGKPSGHFGPIDPSNMANYEFLEQLLQEVTNTFVDQYYHIGGDEVDFSCWKSNHKITRFMEQLGIAGDYPKLESYFINKVINTIKGLNRSYVVWQEVFDNGVHLEKDAIVHVWKPYINYTDELYNVTKEGFRAILSSPWYLDHITYGPDWKKYYDEEPGNFAHSDKQRKYLIGGEACIWTEYIDSTNLLSRTWPRASAVAERLWSDKSVKGWEKAEERFREHRCLLMQRGIQAEPNYGPGFCKCDI